MENKQIKLLLKLLGVEGYQAKVRDVKPTSKTSLTECNRLCRQLREQNLIDTTENLEKITLTPSGKALLQEDSSQLHLSKKELKILTACENGAIAPSQTKVKQAKERDELIKSLIERGFISVAQAKLETIMLTETGQRFLLKEYNPSGTNAVLSLNMLSNYLTFLRKYQSLEIQETQPKEKLTDDEVLALISELDQEHNTKNYLPIFYLRDQLQPPFTREELDQVLYRLEGNQKIETSSLVETKKYSSEQIRAGIPQNVGGPLFFITVV